MKKTARIAIVATVAIAAGVTGLFWNDQVVTGGSTSMVTEAQAIIGRPLTPVSYAGVARRTVRRCAVGVYYC